MSFREGQVLCCVAHHRANKNRDQKLSGVASVRRNRVCKLQVMSQEDFRLVKVMQILPLFGVNF